MVVLLDPSGHDVIVSVSIDGHNHAYRSRKPKLDDLSKAKIIEWLSNGVTRPNKILQLLEIHNLPKITKFQINNLKSRLNHKKSGPLTCTLTCTLNL